MGPNLVDMSNEEIMQAPLSRLTFLRLTAQTYCKLMNLLGPLITSTKALALRACELASNHEMELNLETKDTDFCLWAKKFLINLKNINNIQPFRRAWVPTVKHVLQGFVVSMDGGRLGFGCCVHSISSSTSQSTLDRALCLCKSKISKRNIVSHEVLSGKL